MEPTSFVRVHELIEDPLTAGTSLSLSLPVDSSTWTAARKASLASVRQLLFNSPTFSGVVQAPTVALSSNDGTVATTRWVTDKLGAAGLGLASTTQSGTVRLHSNATGNPVVYRREDVDALLLPITSAQASQSATLTTVSNRQASNGITDSSNLGARLTSAESRLTANQLNSANNVGDRLTTVETRQAANGVTLTSNLVNRLRRQESLNSVVRVTQGPTAFMLPAQGNTNRVQLPAAAWTSTPTAVFPDTLVCGPPVPNNPNSVISNGQIGLQNPLNNGFLFVELEFSLTVQATKGNQAVSWSDEGAVEFALWDVATNSPLVFAVVPTFGRLSFSLPPLKTLVSIPAQSVRSWEVRVLNSYPAGTDRGILFNGFQFIAHPIAHTGNLP